MFLKRSSIKKSILSIYKQDTISKKLVNKGDKREPILFNE